MRVMMKGQLHEMHARVIHLLKYMEEENCLGQKKAAAATAVAGEDDCRRAAALWEPYFL